jgi:hypothetical protein
MQSKISPWHMWGGSTVVTALSGGVVSAPRVTGQVARINYGRPDTWTFYFSARMLSGIGPGGAPIGPGAARIYFDATFGVGRSQVIMPSFAFFRFQWLSGQFPVNGLKYCTTVQTPAPDDQAPTVFATVEQIPAQDINIGCTVLLDTVTNGETADIECSTYWAPRSHVRPEWSRNPPRFLGNEG